MAKLGKKWNCFSCGAKFYDLSKPEAVCPKCGSNQKNAPAKQRTLKKERLVHQIEDDFAGDQDDEIASEEGLAERLGISNALAEGADPGDLKMDDYDE